MNVSEILHFAEAIFWHFQISLHFSAEMADVQILDYLALLFAVCLVCMVMGIIRNW